MSSDESRFSERLEQGLKAHGAVAWRICLRLTGNEADAADAFQNACLLLLRRARRFNAGASERAWICRTMYWAAQNVVKARQRQTRLKERAEVSTNDRQPPDALAEKAETIARVRTAVAGLPELDRLAIELRYYEHLSDREVAEVLECSTEAAGIRIRRAQEELRARLGRGMALVVLLDGLDAIADAEGKTQLPATMDAWLDGPWPDVPGEGIACKQPLLKGVLTMAKNSKVIVGFVCLALVGAGVGWFGLGGAGEQIAGVHAHEGKRLDVATVKDDEVRAFARCNYAFAVELYSRLAAKGDGNLFYSPLSLRLALAMCSAGAGGNTLQEMKSALRLSLPNERSHAAAKATLEAMTPRGQQEYTLRIANSLWGQEGYRFLQPFLDLNTTYYGAGLNTVAFPEPGRTAINRWVEIRTEKKIRDFIPPDALDPLTRLAIVNAIYFRGLWEFEFEKAQTMEAPFFASPNQTVQVSMMTHKLHDVERKPSFRYWEDASLQALELPYKGDALSMAIFLPSAKDGLAQVEKTLTAERLQEWLGKLDQAGQREIPVYLPKFKIAWEAEMNAPLQEIGIKDAFDFAKADFSGMNGFSAPHAQALFVKWVKHKAMVEVDEKGTEAVAVTAILLKPGAPEEPSVFRADHPFLFLIRDNRSGNVVFLGRLTRPQW